MAENQITLLEIMVAGCVVAVGASTTVIVLCLPARFYLLLLPFMIVYLFLSFPFSFLGAFLGIKLTNMRMGIWLGAMMGVVLEFGLLFANLDFFLIGD